MKIFNYYAEYYDGNIVSFQKKIYLCDTLVRITLNRKKYFCFVVKEKDQELIHVNEVFGYHPDVNGKKYKCICYMLYDDEEKILNHFNKLNERNNRYGKIL